MIIELVLKIFYFMMPAYFANMAPVICKKMFNFLAKPIDFGKILNGQPIFGKNKTWRGLIVAVIFGITIAYVQYLLRNTFSTITLIDYSNWFWIGFLLGFGAILGDLVKSFFKRRVGVQSGKSWVPFDQIDYTLGAILFVSIIYFPGWNILITALALNFILHIVVNHIAFWLHIRKERW
jgi:CDP-2,3-bis-(O-geranylgeranyl)-sn-glycerol synthase